MEIKQHGAQDYRVTVFRDGRVVAVSRPYHTRKEAEHRMASIKSDR